MLPQRNENTLSGGIVIRRNLLPSGTGHDQVQRFKELSNFVGLLDVRRGSDYRVGEGRERLKILLTLRSNCFHFGFLIGYETR